MTDKDVTLGEIGRAVDRIEAQVGELRAEVRDRHHKMANDVNEVAVRASTLNIRMENAETNLERIDGEVKAVSTQAARISGAVGLIAFISTLIPWPWKH